MADITTVDQEVTVEFQVQKVCKSCHELKPLDQFHRNKNNIDGRMSICIDCRREYKKTYYDKTQDHQRKRSKTYYHSHKEEMVNYRLRSVYGISLEDKFNILKNQDFQCAECRKFLSIEEAYVDHCHKTDRVRGLLCSKCNLALGLVDDAVNTLSNIKQYLENNNE